jgi:AAA domain-containing protein
VFDPLARMKSASREENAQKEMAPLIEFMRDLREETGAAVAFVHHTGHTGTHMRGSSDLESAWETRLDWSRENQSSDVTVKSEHREAEACDPIRYRIVCDHETRTMRFPLIEDDLRAQVRAYLREHPEARSNEVDENVTGNRQAILSAVREIRAESSSEPENHIGTGRSGAPSRGGSSEGSFRSLGTTAAEPSQEQVLDPGTKDRA